MLPLSDAGDTDSDVERIAPFDVSGGILKTNGRWLILVKVTHASDLPACDIDTVNIELFCHHPPPTVPPTTNRPSVTLCDGNTDAFSLTYSESFSILYDLTYVPTAKTEVWHLSADISWTSSDHVTHSTNHKLCKLKIRRYPFIVSPVTATPIVKQGERFAVTYELLNNLYDFIGSKLYWHPPDLENHAAVICHDPNLHLGPFPKNSSRSGIIEFQILKPGVYELGQAMKINLRYSLSGGEQQTASRPALIPRRVGQRTPASKSQSMNDMMPLTSQLNDSKAKRPTQDDSLTQMFTALDDPLNPGNFIKNPLYVCSVLSGNLP